MSCRSGGSNGLPEPARTWSTLAGAVAASAADCPAKRWMRWACATDCGMCRRCQHLVGNSVGFPFQRVVARADGEFGLQAFLAAARLAFAALTRVAAAGAFALQQKAAPRI